MCPSSLLPDPSSVTLEEILVDHDRLILIVRAARPAASCPDCGVRTERVHSWYWRTLRDLPWAGRAVGVRLRTRRWRCANPRCGRQIFTERLPAVAAPYARRTTRLASVVEAIAFALGGEAGARLLERLAVRLSGDTLLHTIRAAPIGGAATPAVLGVDDFALRRGRRYGTLLVDLEARRPVDLLPEATSAAVAAWLRAHPGVRLICRDRGGVYAEGARLGAPDAIQIADRWHLFANLGEALARAVLAQQPSLPPIAAPTARPGGASEASPVARRTPAGSVHEQARQARQRSREARYEEVQALLREGLSLRAIARRTGLQRRTVRRYARAPACPDGRRRPRPRLVTPYLPYLRERWDAGERRATVLWEELRARGFRGSYGRVAAAVVPWRQEPGAAGVRAAEPAVRPCTPRQLAYWLSCADEELTPEQRAYLAALTAACPPLGAAGALAREFVRLLRARDVAALDPWLAEAEASESAPLRHFAAGLRRDRAAIAAALEYEWSSGQVEGQITRLKLVKRQMYGRAKSDLLRQRVLRAG